ncbi:mediator of RNA polymerase II transcription subunit 9 [Eublepharis macularius]|uniref:Mediator of RNA polymerase II transcription subunit 9 n=1 Tax=Eublepharis macularius TaxID=481883 RepID=A0AA97K5W8_EUBMA|nr:mediator of RNA polymerase II transcription subunit 9 [Eublepharis macularius]
MAAPGASAAVGGSRAEEQPPPPAAPSSQAPVPQAAEQAGQPQPQQPSPAEQKFQPPPAQPPPPSAQAPPPPPAQRPDQEDASFLPLVHDIIKCMDKDSQDVHQVLSDLRTKFVEMRKLIKSMQGIGVSPERQQEQLQSLREQVRTKSELLQKYKSLCMFEIPKE